MKGERNLHWPVIRTQSQTEQIHTQATKPPFEGADTDGLQLCTVAFHACYACDFLLHSSKAHIESSCPMLPRIPMHAPPFPMHAPPSPFLRFHFPVHALLFSHADPHHRYLHPCARHACPR